MSTIFYVIEINGEKKRDEVEKDNCSNVVQFRNLVLAAHSQLSHLRYGDLIAYKPGTTSFSEEAQLRNDDLDKTNEDQRIIVKIRSVAASSSLPHHPTPTDLSAPVASSASSDHVYTQLALMRAELQLALEKPSVSEDRKKQISEAISDVAFELKRARTITGLAFTGSTLVTTVPIAAVSNKPYWKAEVIDKKVPRTMVDPANSTFLPVERTLVSELRWLNLRHAARSHSLDSIKSKKRSRADKADLEVPFHGTLLYLCRAAANGQEDVEFGAEDHRAETRADWNAFVRREHAMELAAPEECKSVVVLAKGTDDDQAIDGNDDPFGKLLKVCRFHHLDQGKTTVCIFAAKIDYIWLIAFKFDEARILTSIEVTPKIPMKGSSILGCKLTNPIVDLDAVNNLLDLLPGEPSAGFRLLCRYVDLLSNDPVPISLTRVTGELIDLTSANILAYGHHSLVLRSCAEANFVIKISREDLIEHEVKMHHIIDVNAPSNIRKMVPDGYGSVQGAGSGLSFIMLEGVGTPFEKMHFKQLRTAAWSSIETAVQHIHACNVIHRDIKPANMIYINGTLLLNDFDAACTKNDSLAMRDLRAGTPLFHSPKLNELWKERDDWLGVALSLLSFDHPFTNDDASKSEVLTDCLELMPESMQERVKAAFM